MANTGNNENSYVEIGEKIKATLKGEAQNNALEFVAFLRANDMPIQSNKDGQGWAVGGVVGNSSGYMLVNGAAQLPGPWTVWFNSCEFPCGETANDELKEAAWSHASFCGRCHSNWESCGGGERTIFGKEFSRLCHSPLMFCDPDATTLENMKKLMLMLDSPRKPNE